MDDVTARTFTTRLDETRGAVRAGRRHDPARLRRDVEILADVAAAIGALHDQGALHLDLRPDLVLLDGEDRPGVQPREGSNPGGVYLGPEQVAGDARKIGVTTDVWALGVILHEILTGAAPFVDAAAIARADSDPARSCNRHAPEALEAVCLRAMGKQPFQRYRAAQAFEQELRRWLRGEDVSARGASPLLVARRWARRRKGLVAAVAIAAVALILGWAWSRSGG